MSETPRITFVSRKWPPAMGGMETYALALSEALQQHAEVETFYLPGHADGSVPSKGALVGFGLRTAARLLFARNPAPVTHIADMASWPLALCARIRRFGGRQVLSAHGTDVAYPLRGGLKGRVYGAYLRLGALLLGPVKVIANSAATAEAAQRFGFRNTCVVPLAADVTVKPAHLMPKTLLFSGRLVARKGFAWFAQNVLPLLPEDMTLSVAGTIWDADEGAALDNPRVTYLGRLEQSELWKAYSAALCVVVPNIDVPNGEFEGFGLVALEVAAAGGVVLASHHSGLKEAVVDTETGFHLPPGDAALWASKIREIAGWSDVKRAAFTKGAQAICASHYTWDRVAVDTFAAYEMLPQKEIA